MGRELLIDWVGNPARKSLTTSAVPPLTLRLQESKDSPGRWIAKGLYGLADVPTANGRVYPRALWVREIARLKEAMKQKRVFGEADHPEDGRTKVKRVSHILLDLELTESGEVIGTSEIIDTTNGKEVKAIFAAGGEVGVSSRGYGSVHKDGQGYDQVEEDFQLDTFDFVVDPAQSAAYPEVTVEATAKPEGQMAIKEGTEPAKTDASTTAAAANTSGEAKKEDAADPKDEEPKKEDDGYDKSKDMKDPPKSLESKEVEAKIEQAVAKATAALRAEVTSRLLSDPKVAGAKLALESVKSVLRPFILDKDINSALEEKDNEIKALKVQVESLTSQSKKVQTENAALSKAVKDLGFKFFVTQTLAGHPKLETILSSFGDLTLVENVDALKKMVEPHKVGLKGLRTEEVSASRKLLESKDAELGRVSESLKTALESNKKAVLERDTAMDTAHKATLALYLERSISGNPSASAIRVKFKEMKHKTKDAVDALVEAYTMAAPRRGSDFQTIRSRLGGRGRPSATLVEDNFRDSGTLNGPESMAVLPGVQMDTDEINRLAGVKS